MNFSQTTDLSLQALGEGFRELGYSLPNIARLMKLEATPAAVVARSPVNSFIFADEFAQAKDPLQLLVALFWLNRPVLMQDYNRIVEPTLRELITRSQLVRSDGQTVRPTVSITAMDGLLFLADPPFINLARGKILKNAQSDAVMPLHASSVELLSRCDPGEVGDALLDIGCGCGCLALLLHSEGKRVFGIDINPRATRFARSNAVLNQIPVAFSTRDATQAHSDLGLYERAIFNVPCRLNLAPGNVDLSPGMRVVTSTLNLMYRFLRRGGLLQLHCIFPVRRQDGDLEAAIRRCVEGPQRLLVQFEPIPSSPFALSRSAIESEKLPFGTYLTDEPRDGQSLFRRIRLADVIEIIPAVVTLRNER